MANGIIANSIINALAGLMLLVTGFASAIIAARLLGPEANGIIAFSLWLVMSGASIAELGSSVMLLKMLPQLKAQGYDAKRRRGFSALLITPTLVAVLVLLALYAGAFLTSEKFHWAKTAPSVALVTGILFVIQAIGSFSKFYLIGEKRLGAFFKLTVAVSVVQLAGVLYGAIHFGVEGALIGYAAGQVVLFLATLPVIFVARDRCDVPRNYLASSSLIISLEFIVDSIFLNRLELLFLQQFWSVTMVGFYAAGLSIANMALQVPIQLTGSLLPFYSERRHEAGGSGLSAKVISDVTRSLSYVTLPMSIGLAAIAQELVVTVFGEPFRQAGATVALLALAAPGAAFMQTLSLYLLSQDRAKERLVIGIIAGVIMVAACLALVPFLGGEGAATARIIVFAAMCVMMLRGLDFGRELHSLYITPLKVTAASLACGLAAMLVLKVSGGAIGLVLAIIAGAMVYIPALRLFRAVPEIDAEFLLQASSRFPGRIASVCRRIVRFVAPQNLLEENTGHGNEEVEGAGRPAAHPTIFNGTVGLFQPEDEATDGRDVAVLLLSPWGYDDMCLRKSHRIFAERLAARGIPSLRFDYPDTGDSFDTSSHPDGLAAWERTAIAAAEHLREISGRSNLVLVGHGIGATIAHRISARLDHVAGLAMLAPVMNGRQYLREIGLRAKFIYEDLGLTEEQRELEGISVAGLRMSEKVASDIKALKLDPAVAKAERYLIVERALRIGDTTLREGLAKSGADVELIEYQGYDELMTMPLTARFPGAVFQKLEDWVFACAGDKILNHPSRLPPANVAAEGNGFREIHVRFGTSANLLGAVCMPQGAITGKPVLLLSTAYDRQSGWGRTSVAMARELARRGIPSLRYDPANVADSPPDRGAPDQILYHESQNRDALLALDLLQDMTGREYLTIAGRCSGGYVAFRSGFKDPRVAGIVAVNPFVFYWNPSEKVPEDISVVPRSLNDYGSRFTRMETVRRLVKGEINVRAACRNIVVALSRRLSFRFSSLIVRVQPKRRVVFREVRNSFASYEKRGVPVTIMYSEADVGLEHLYFHFGAGGHKLGRYRNVRLVMMPDADHNLTPDAARKKWFDEIAELSAA